MVFLPQDIYSNLGIEMIISKYWLVAIPCHFYVTLVFIIIFYYLLSVIKDNEIELKRGILKIN